MVDQPSEEDRLGFVRSYGVEPVTDINTDLTFKDAALSVAEMTPIIGDAMAAKEVYDELMKEDPNYKLIAALGGAALIGTIPGIGDAAAAGIRKAADVAKRIEVDPDAVGMMGGNIRLKPKEQVDFDAEMAALDGAEDATTWQQNAKKVVKKRGIDLDDKKSPEALELQESTRLLLENKITRDEHLANVDRLKPVGEYDQLPREPSDKALVFALDSGKREKGVFVLDDETASKLGANTSSLKVGDQFNSRLDIPAYLAHDTWIVAGTSPAVKTADGKGVTSYAKAVHFGGDGKPVRFIASPQRSEKIGTGVENKTGYATVSGTVKDLDADAIRATAAELLDDPDWVQVGFDPRRQGGFYVRAGENKHVPVREATEVIQIGPLVLAKNAKLDLEYQGYSEGGMALEDQMEMNFGDVPDNTIGIDPVSGNEIPLGSTAENVRDDIPANLSEGEIVVPADVVNFHGVKLFEDLRREAKMGYAEMAEDGRIGGEPMDMDEPVEEDELGLELADLEIIELSEDPVTMDKGGYNSKPPKFKNRYEKIMYYLTKFMQDEEEEEKKLKGPSIAEQINFGGKYNEGGMASDEQPFYSQKGGFDMSRADVPIGSPIGDTGTVPTGMVELREYMNDAGHKIVITFVDGEPTTDIPVGYYPVSTIVTPSPSVATPSDRDDKPSMPMPEGINYKQLSVQELTDMVSGQQDSKITNMVSKLAMASNPVMGVLMKVAMADQSRKLKSEVQRRLDDPATTDLDRMKLNNLMEIEGESTFIERLFGKEPAKMIAKPKDNEAFVAAAIADPEKFLAPVEDVYEPEVTTPEVSGLDPEIMKQVEQASKEAAEIAFGDRVSTPQPTPVNEMSDRVKQARQNTQKLMKDMRDRGASREERTESLKAAARTEQVLKDMDRGIIRGFEKGGLMQSKKKKATKNKK